MPLAIRWPRKIPAGTRVQPFVGHADIAPTLLEAAGLAVPAAMTGHSVLALAGGAAPGGSQRATTYSSSANATPTCAAAISAIPPVAFAQPTTCISATTAPIDGRRAILTWDVAVGPFGDIDDGPTKQLLLSRGDDPPIKRYFELAVAETAGRGIVRLEEGSRTTHQRCGRSADAAVRDRLKKELDAWQRTTRDPRATEDDDRWDRYPVLWSPRKEVRKPSPQPSAPCGGSRLARLSRLADVEARDQAILDPENVADHLVHLQHRSLEVAHCLVDLDDGLAINAG